MEKQTQSSGSPKSSICYLAPNVGTFWLLGKKPSGQNKSCATFVWYHGVTDFDTHCQELTFVNKFIDANNLTWWHYTMPTRNEDGTETIVDVLFEIKKAGDQARIYYRRDGKGTATSPKDLPDNKLSSDNKDTGGFILWTWNATVFDGHEDD